MTANKLDKALACIRKLPSLPIVYVKLSRLLQSTNATVQSISSVIAGDPPIAAKVLGFVNSAFYGFPKRIGDLQRAVVILGVNEIRNLVLAMSTIQVFRQAKSEHGFSMDRLWEHSIACAVASRVLAEAAHLENPETVFAAGLMHDIGKVIHAIGLPEEFGKVLDEAGRAGKHMIELEDQIIGFNHAQTGKEVAVKWNFPQETVHMIACHHLTDPSVPITKEIAAVHVANTLSTALGLGSSGEKQVPVVNEKAWSVLNLRLSQLETVMARTEKVYAESVDILKS